MYFVQNTKMAASLIRQAPRLRKICSPQVSGLNKCIKRQIDDERARKKAGLHPETSPKGMYENPPIKGKIVDKKPFPLVLEAGKNYFWCTCGVSKNQPFCDGSHKREWQLNKGQTSTAVKFLPHKFQVQESKKYWLCMCKQTDNRPFCDGTHQNEDIQAKVKS